MLKKTACAGFITALLSLNAYAVSTQKEYMDFFNKYDALSKAYDPAVADLYMDDAKVYVIIQNPDDTEVQVTLSGKKLKSLVGDAMSLAKKVGEVSQYSNIRLENISSDSVKILADRYSLYKCQTDKSYYMVVKKNPQGNLNIIEESSKGPSESQCKEGVKDDVALQLAFGVKMAASTLPKKVDGDTLFESVSSSGKELTQTYKMINFKAEELDKAAFKEAMQPMVLQHICRIDVSKKELLDKGAVMIVKYKSSDDVLIASMRVDAAACKALS